MIERDDLVGRLQHVHERTQQRVFGRWIFLDAAAQIERDGREIERLREALQPFASAADDYCGEWMEDDYSPFWAEFFVCGDFRRARAALNGEGET